MAKRPYMKLWVADFVGDTTTLSDAEVGSYILILLAMWNSETGRLTMDQTRNASRAGRAFARRWEALSGYFELDASGRVFNARLLKEIAAAEKVSEAKKRPLKLPPPDLFPVQNMAPYGRQNMDASDATDEVVNSLNYNDVATANAGANGGANGSRHARDSIAHSSESIEPETPSPSSNAASGADDWPDVAATDLLDLLAEAVRNPWLDPTKDISLSLRRSAHPHFARWKSAGFSWTLDIVPTAQFLAVKAARRIESLRYFDGAIADAHRMRTAAVPEARPYAPGSRFPSKAEEAAARDARILASFEDQPHTEAPE